jgi:hypothetical protein
VSDGLVRLMSLMRDDVPSRLLAHTNTSCRRTLAVTAAVIVFLLLVTFFTLITKV